MDSKGFTLVELTAIIVIFAAIFLMVFPNLINIANSNKEKEYDSVISNLCLAGKSYIYSNLDEFSELSTVGSEINLDVNLLILNEYIDGNTINPKTDSKIEDGTLKYKVSSDYSLKCEYIEG